MSAKGIVLRKKYDFHYSFMSQCPVDLKPYQTQSEQNSLAEWNFAGKVSCNYSNRG